VGWLFRNGQINEREARSHPRRKVLQKALGGGNQFVDPQVGAVGYEPGDAFLLCTDGLVEGLFDSQINELLRSGLSSKMDSNLAQQLVHESLNNGCRDNSTALLIEIPAASASKRKPRPARTGRGTNH
jgi:serine/threonine protein phosphatase PrpC